MRVAHVTRWFSLLSETFLYDTVTEEARLGVEAGVFTVKRANVADRPHAPVETLPLPPRLRPDRLLRRAWDAVRADRAPRTDWIFHRSALRAALERFRPEVVHAHFGAEGVMAAPVARALGLPLVVTFYGYDLSRLVRHPAWRRAYAGLFAQAAAVTSVSDLMRARAVELGCPADRSRTIHIGKRLRDYAFALRPAPPLRYVSVGRLVHKKGHLDAVAALAEARRRGLQASLRIIGDGPLQGDIQAAVQRAGVSEAVELVGPLPHPAMIGELERADAFMLCSKVAPDGDEEGIPTVFAEAQAAGLPCVATRHAGIPEGIAPEGHGLLAPEGDVGGLADRMLALAAMPAAERAALAEAGRRHVMANFELEAQTRRYLDLYREVLRGA